MALTEINFAVHEMHLVSNICFCFRKLLHFSSCKMNDKNVSKRLLITSCSMFAFSKKMCVVGCAHINVFFC